MVYYYAHEQCKRVWTISFNFEMLAAFSRYDFRTLKLTKSEIFSNLVRGPWKGPRWFLLKEMLSGMVSFDVLKGPEFILVHLKTLSFDLFHFLGVCMAIWGFGLGTLRWIHCGNGIRSGVAWETETSCFGQKWSTIMPMNSAKEFEPFIWTLRCWQPSQGTISAL